MTECRVCSEPFDKARMGQIVCGIKCAQRLPVVARNTLKAQAKAEKKRDAERREALKSLSDWKAEAQAQFNTYIRLRDVGKPCVSCGTYTGKMNAGHYLSRGSHPELALDEANTHKQCEACNTHKHGNPIPYRAELIRRIGLAGVERLEGPHTPKKYTRDELRAIRDEYRRKAKEMAK